MAKKLPRPQQISVGGVSTPALPIHTLISIKDSMSAECIYWREKQAQTDAAFSAKQGELDKLEATVRNQEVELRRLRKRIAEIESKFGEVML